MLPRNRTSSHPGIILWKEFLEPSQITQTLFAKHIGLSIQTTSRSLENFLTRFIFCIILNHDDRTLTKIRY